MAFVIQEDAIAVAVVALLCFALLLKVLFAMYFFHPNVRAMMGHVFLSFARYA
jgi:hypothetical protein